MKNIKNASRYLMAFCSGSLASSIGLYIAYDQWHPMVWSAAAVAGIAVLINFMTFMEEGL